MNHAFVLFIELNSDTTMYLTVKECTRYEQTDRLQITDQKEVTKKPPKFAMIKFNTSNPRLKENVSERNIK